MARPDVVVVGGGVIGCSVGLHLARAGAKVLVIERDGVGQATSAAGAGFVGLWAAGWMSQLGEEELALERYGLRFYKELAADGYEFGYRQNGNLYAATSPEAWERDVESIASNVDAAPGLRRLTAVDVEELTDGVLPARSVHAGAFHPDGCQVSAPEVPHALADALESSGGTLSTRMQVTRVVVAAGRVTGVETSQGLVPSRNVVVAAGAWSSALLDEHHVSLPQVPLAALRVLSEPIGVPASLPTIMIRDLSIYFREEKSRVLFGWHITRSPRFSFVSSPPPERFVQLPLDGFFELLENAKRASRSIPMLQQARSFAVAIGAPTYTPDRRPVFGHVPQVEGLFVASGCNEAGITHAPGFGKLMAELICEGEPTLCPIDAFRADRFGDRFARGSDIARSLHPDSFDEAPSMAMQ